MGQLLAESVGAAGDSLTAAFNADTDFCTYGDQTERSFVTGDDHGGAFCEAGDDGTFSHAERLECSKGGNIAISSDAEDGADMLDFQPQASSIRGRLTSAAGPHYVSISLGHNDACSNETDRTGNSCTGDRDPDNYCRTSVAAYEREFRRGLDELIQIPSARIAVLGLIRISQLCNLGGKDACGPLLFFDCDEVWEAGEALEEIFGTPGICASLTNDCSDQRRIDMYQTIVDYNEVLQRVTAEYAALAPGAMSPNGAVKAENVALGYIEAPFHYRLHEDDLSCCDCFHPSDVGHRKVAQFTWDGLPCSEQAPCCAPSDDPLVSARCDMLDTTSMYPGGFWANGVICGNRIIDPGESCDDGNSTGGDGCSDVCMVDGGATPTPSPSPTTPDATPQTPTPSPTPPDGTPQTPTASPDGTPPTPTVSPDGTPPTPTASPDGTPPTPTASPDGTPPSPTATGGSVGCIADCNGSVSISIDELVLAVNIALGLQPLSQCPPADGSDADTTVDIDELIGAVNASLSGCG